MPGEMNTSPQSSPAPQAKWTVMVYMAAGDGADLDAHAVADLREMERAAVGAAVDVVVQIDRFWPARPQRYHLEGQAARLVRPDVVAREPILDTGLSGKQIATAKAAKMSDAATLANFLVWARANYPADRYFLVLWGHAYGLGFGRDHGEPLTLPEIRKATEAFRRGMPLEEIEDAAAKGEDLPPLGPKLDLIGANACAVSYAEAACELAEHADYLVASEIAVPFAGWPYDVILSRLSRGQGGAALTAEQLGTLVADRYVSQFVDSRGGERVAMSVLSLSRAGQLKSHVTSLATALEALVDSSDADAGRRRAQLRAAFLSTAGGDVRPMLDLYDLAKRLTALCNDLTVLEPSATAAVQDASGKLNTAASTIMSFIRPDPPPPTDSRVTPATTAFVVARRAHRELTDLHGVGIFAPFVTDERDLKRLGLDEATPETGRSAYFSLAFSAANRWPALVYDVLRTALAGEVVTGVERSGATTRAERLEVTQLLASVDAVFDVLDWRIAATTARVVEQMPSAAAATAVAGQGRALEGTALNLLGKLKLVQHAEVDKMFASIEAAKGAPKSGPSRSAWLAPSAGTAAQATAVAEHFLRLEGALAETEQAVRRTLTNGTFGLGPGLGRDKEGFLGRDKEGFLGRDKEGFLGRDKEGFLGRDKEGFLGRDKEAFLGRDKEGFLGRDKEGFLGLLTGALLAERALQPTAADIVADLFGQVGDAMQDLEAAAAEAETLAAKALLSPSGAPGFEPLATVTLAKARVERAMDTLAEASSVLRQTVRRVAAHPAYGIGPGPQGLTVEDRRVLARAGGLNGRRLALL